MGKLSKLDKNYFLTLKKDLKSDARLAEKLNCTRQHVARLRKKFGLPNTRKGIQKRNEEILRLHKEMIPGIDIARAFHLSVSYVYRIIRESKNKIKEGNLNGFKKIPTT